MYSVTGALLEQSHKKPKEKSTIVLKNHIPVFLSYAVSIFRVNVEYQSINIPRDMLIFIQLNEKIPEIDYWKAQLLLVIRS